MGWDFNWCDVVVGDTVWKSIVEIFHSAWPVMMISISGTCITIGLMMLMCDRIMNYISEKKKKQNMWLQMNCNFVD